MKRRTKLLAVALVVGGLSACHPVSREEFLQLRADHEALKANHDLVVNQLKTWSKDMEDWGLRTYQTICDVAKANSSGNLNKYGDVTKLYCGESEGGTPPPPPNWGQE